MPTGRQAACIGLHGWPHLAAHTLLPTGNYVALPTPATQRLFNAWAGSAVAAIKARKQDQFYLPKLNHLYDLCNAQFVCREKRDEQVRRRTAVVLCLRGAVGCGCFHHTGTRPTLRLVLLPLLQEEASGRQPAAEPKQGDSPESQEAAEGQEAAGPKALFRTFPPSFWMYSSDVCALIHPDSLPLVDTCDWSGEGGGRGRGRGGGWGGGRGRGCHNHAACVSSTSAHCQRKACALYPPPRSAVPPPGMRRLQPAQGGHVQAAGHVVPG